MDKILVKAGQKEAEQILRAGSKSFYFAARLLGRNLRRDVASLYAFCRLSDDAVDESETPREALNRIKAQLDRVYAPERAPKPFTARPLLGEALTAAFAAAVVAHQVPRAPFDALVEGYVWDAEARAYETFDALLGYCARVASSVGIIMTHAMRRHHPFLLNRAVELGLAMQLTNIARDIATDAQMGRVYMPDSWLAEVGMTHSELLSAGPHNPAVALLTRKTLIEAEKLYRRAGPGIRGLPRSARGAIGAASAIYEDIGRSLSHQAFDPFSQRAWVSTWRKVWLSSKSLLAAYLGASLRVPEEHTKSTLCPKPARFLLSPSSGLSGFYDRI